MPLWLFDLPEYKMNEQQRNLFMNWTNIDFPGKITDTIKIESMNKEGLFVVKYLGQGGVHKTLPGIHLSQKKSMMPLESIEFGKEWREMHRRFVID